MKLPDSVIAINTADLHIDEHNWADRSDICGDSMWSFEWIVSLAVENQKPLILAGDVFERKLNYAATIAFVRRQLERLNAPLFFIQGQHDCQLTPWLLSLSDNEVYWLGGEQPDSNYWKVGGYTLDGLDWTPPALLPERLATIRPGTDIVVMHQVTQELMGSIRLPEMSVRSVPHAKLVVMGDYHRHTALHRTGAQGQNLLLISPGSTNMREISEPYKKYVYLLHDDLSVSSLRIPTRFKWATDVPDEEFLDELVTSVAQDLQRVHDNAVVAGIPKHLCKPLVRIRFDSEIPNAYHRIKDAVGDAGHLFADPLPEDPSYNEEDPDEPEQLLEDDELQHELDEVGAVACLPECVNEADNPELFNLCRRLLTEEGTAAALSEERSRFIG